MAQGAWPCARGLGGRQWAARRVCSPPFRCGVSRAQLFESPILTHVRLQLLEPESHPYLLKALWGILMLLPQSPAYHTLKNRLSSVPEIGLLRLQLAHMNVQAGAKGGGAGSGAAKSTGVGGGAGIDFRSLLRTYEDVQAKHLRLVQQRQKSGARASGGSAT